MQATRRTQGGHWHGQLQAYGPQSYAPQPAGSLDFQQQHPSGKTHRDHQRPRFYPDYLPRVWFGQDVATWIAKIEHIVLEFGEEIVCTEIFAHSFISGDAIRLWYMHLPEQIKMGMTTDPGCWKRFRLQMEQRFPVGVSLRQIVAELQVWRQHLVMRWSQQEPEPLYGCRPHGPEQRYRCD
jgi:hypothetical protein